MGKKTFLGLFSIEEDAKKSNSTPQTEPIPVPGTVSGYVAPPSNVSSTYQTIPSPSIPSNQDNEKIQAYINELFKNANLPGPDYFEFKDLLVELINDMPETKAFQAAFKGLAKQGLTKQTLLDSAAHYIVVLENDEKETQAQINNSKQANVDGLKLQIENKKKQIDELNAQLLSLQNQISQSQEEIKSLNNQVLENEQKISNKQNAYKFVIQQKKMDISNDIQKINSFIQ